MTKTKSNCIVATLALAILLAHATILLYGCVSIDYGTFHYRSFGGRTFDSLEGVKDGNDILVEVKNYKSESVTDALREMKETIQAVR